MKKYEKLLDNLIKLHLTNIAETLEQHADKVNSQKESFSEALLALTNSELAYQEKLERQRRIKRARFPVVKRLNEFNYNFQPSIDEQQIKELATMSFVQKRENILFLGSPGVGKTHLSIALGVEACNQGIRTLFINCHDLLLRLQKAKEKNHLERVIRRYQSK